MNALRDAACEYALAGWAVLPLQPRGKAPLGSLVPKGLTEASSDLATVFRWWQATPAANVGLACEQSGLVVIDVDPRHGGDDQLWEATRKLGPLPLTVEAQTGGGGVHIFFTHPGVALRGRLSDGIDLKAHGYVLLDPSIHPSGAGYVWLEPPSETPLAEVPPAWLEVMRTQRRATRATVSTDHDDELRNIPAEVYIAALTDREPNSEGFVQCPFHKGGNERTPSLSPSGTLWACYGCEPLLGKTVQGGNVYDFAGLLWGYAIPLRGADFDEARGRLRRLLCAS